MQVIDLNDFIQKVRNYPRSEKIEESYKQTLKRKDIWGKLEEIDDSKMNDALKFLNSWGCRLSYSCCSNLTKMIRGSSVLLSKFHEHHLDNINWDSLLIDSEAIEEAFEKIASIQAGRRTVGATATSKIMHMVNPNFFMICDHEIRYDYGCSDNALGYVNFMWRMKLFADVVIREYSTKRNMPVKSVFSNLVTECKSNATTLPKLLDEYNWVKSHHKTQRPEK